MNCQFGIEVCKASLSNLQLMGDVASIGSGLQSLGQRLLIRFQFFDSLDLALLFRDSQITGHRSPGRHLDRRLANRLPLPVAGLDRVHSGVFREQVHDVQRHVPFERQI